MSFTNTYFTTWSIGEDYQIRFKGSRAEGTFSGLTGKIYFNPENLSTAEMDVKVKANTINTGNKTKDKHARGKNWFDAKTYPDITFKSKLFKKVKDGYEVIGQLNLHGITKEIVIPFTFEQSSEGGMFMGSFTVNRKDYGIRGPLLGVVVGNDFEVDLKVPVSSASGIK